MQCKIMIIYNLRHTDIIFFDTYKQGYSGLNSGLLECLNNVLIITSDIQLYINIISIILF